jgi:replicative DNA helicase
MHDIQIEQGFLGGVLLDNRVCTIVQDLLRPEHFFEPIHGTIYEICHSMIRAGRTANPTSLRSYLPDADILGLTVQQYIARLTAEGMPQNIAVDYARSIRDLADQRAIAVIGAELSRTIPQDPETLAAQGIEALDAVVAGRSMTGAPALGMKEAIARAIDATAGAYQREGRITGLTWGLRDMDEKTLGLQRGELVVAAGRPGMGKSALGLCFSRCVTQEKYRGLYVSLEMGDVPLMQRMLADEMFEKKAISYWMLRAGRFSESDFELMMQACQRLSELPLRIEQQPGLSVAQISARARQMKRKTGLDFIVVDHLHLVRASDRYAGNRVMEVGEVTSGLKGLAKELDIAVLALCQLSRQVEGRDDKRPGLGDLKWSGEIEQDADTVVMLYRPAYYLERKKPNERDGPEVADWISKMQAVENELELIIEKQRNGPVGIVKAFCNISCNAIRDLARQEHPL